jgi:hypothetical protein
MTDTRLFFVVDSAEKNEEIFPTLEQAERYFREINTPADEARLYIGLVKNAYIEPEATPDMRAMNDGWNYEDDGNTFAVVKVLKGV